MRRTCAAMNLWLASFYALSNRTGLDLKDTSPRVVNLTKDAAIRLSRDSQVRQIEVAEGTVWLTGSPARGDVLLQHGERYDLSHDWPFVVQAIGEAKLVLLP